LYNSFNGYNIKLKITELLGGIPLKKKIIILSILLIFCTVFSACRKPVTSSAESVTPTLTTPTPVKTQKTFNNNWKCIYMGAMVMDDTPKIEHQLIFDDEDKWLKYAYDNLPNSIVDIIDQDIDWGSEGVVVLQNLAAKGYFSFIPPVRNVTIDNGILGVEYEDNLDSSKTFYVRSDDYSDMIKEIYMILLGKSDIEKLH